MLSALENREGLPQIKLCASGQGCGQVLGGVARPKASQSPVYRRSGMSTATGSRPCEVPCSCRVYLGMSQNDFATFCCVSSSQ